MPGHKQAMLPEKKYLYRRTAAEEWSRICHSKLLQETA